MKYLRALSIVLFVASAVSLGVVFLRGSGPSTAAQVSPESNEPVEFSALSDASEAFGFEMPDVTAPGWEFSRAVGTEPRDVPDGDFSFYVIFLHFKDSRTGDGFELTINPAGPGPDIQTESVALGSDRDAEVARDGDRIGIFWQESGRSFTVNATLSEDFSEDDLLKVLATLE